jgi:hypothetical protein
MVSSMIAFGVGTLVMLSAAIFLAHTIDAYQAESEGPKDPSPRLDLDQ